VDFLECDRKAKGHGMDERLRTLLNQIPEKPPRSKLEPHLEVIRELRRKGRTYQEIAHFFGEHLNVTVAASTIHAFVQVRARRRKQLPQIELPPPTGPTETAPAAANDGLVGTTTDVRERIAAIKQRRPPEKAPKPKFEYNENEPLHLAPGTNQEG
jgi:IS30 family transposase